MPNTSPSPSLCQDKNASVQDSYLPPNTYWVKQLQVLAEVTQTNQITASSNNKAIFFLKQETYAAGGFVPSKRKKNMSWAAAH